MAADYFRHTRTKPLLGAGLTWSLGALSALAMPPTDFWWVFFLTVPLFILRLENITASRQALVQGWLFGFGYFCAALHWIGFAFLVDASTYLWMMPFAVGGLAAVMAVYWALAAGAAVFAARLRLPVFLCVPAFLAVAEYLRGHLMTGFPWAAPGLAFDGMGPMVQLASLIGMPGLTLVILLWCGALRGIFMRSHMSEQIISTLILLAAVPAYWWGAARLSAPTRFAGGVNVLLVQPNVPQSDKWRGNNASEIFDNLIAQSSGTDATHVIWPESAVPFLLDESPAARDRLRQLLSGGKTLITGAIRRAAPEVDADYFTSIEVYNGEAELVSTYDKWRLVPGGEFLPLSWVLEPLGFKKLARLPDGFTAGAGPGSITVPGAGQAAAAICYEAIFPDRFVAQGPRPQWIVNVTNDGWFGTSTGPYQHFAQLRMRAVEQGLPALRSANTGISGAFDGLGRPVGQTQLGQKTSLLTGLPLPEATPVYARWGDFALMLLLAATVLVAAGCAQLTLKGEKIAI